MKILVTGSAGFIGSHITHRLLTEGHQVFGVDNLSNGKFENIDKAFGSGNFVFLEQDFVEALPQLNDFEAVIHLAALGSVPRSIENPGATFSENVSKFHQLLCAMKDSTCKRLIYASSSSVLGGTSVANPRSPYAVSKYMNELYAEQFSAYYGIQTIGLRFFNVYGPNQRHDSPYAAVIPRLLFDDHIKIHAPGTQSRAFTYVKDVVSAIMAVLNGPPINSKVYNVGHHESRNLYELVNVLRRLLPERKFDFEVIAERPGDVLVSLCDNSELKKDTGWSPAFDLEQGLTDMLFGTNT